MSGERVCDWPGEHECGPVIAIVTFQAGAMVGAVYAVCASAHRRAIENLSNGGTGSVRPYRPERVA